VPSGRVERIDLANWFGFGAVLTVTVDLAVVDSHWNPEYQRLVAPSPLDTLVTGFTADDTRL
jgi:hypothetical protein